MSEKFRVLVVAVLAASFCQVDFISRVSASTGDAHVTFKQTLAAKNVMDLLGEARMNQTQQEKAPLIRVAPGGGGCDTCREDWDVFRWG